MSQYEDVCNQCGKTFTNHDVDPLRFCSVGCQIDRHSELEEEYHAAVLAERDILRAKLALTTEALEKRRTRVRINGKEILRVPISSDISDAESKLRFAVEALGKCKDTNLSRSSGHGIECDVFLTGSDDCDCELSEHNQWLDAVLARLKP